ncbi:dynein light chain roadblock-type 2 isoform X2 [Gallus gallus]|uniref:dynein light chain roadblock-type 2 isoform X2 n=1 Tax=Gallus gallus TaxID=9031 RepID=UPI001F00DD80|nr:dynein light chain roadblock-type 2 isoform X2 [Gallus gallus]
MARLPAPSPRFPPSAVPPPRPAPAVTSAAPRQRPGYGNGAAPARCPGTGTALGRAEVEETLKRIQAHKGVVATMVVNAEGIPIRTTLDNSTTVHYAGLLHQLTMKARSTVRDIDPQNDLTFLRIRSKKHEIMVAPDKEYLLIVIQNPSE